MFELSRDSGVPLVDQITERLTSLIRDGQVAPGVRLPSIRKLAMLTGASAFTVVDAYDRLVARGVIESRAGKGFFAAPRPLATPLLEIESVTDPGSGALALARLSLTPSAEIIAAGSGFLPETWLMEAAPGTILTRLARGRRPQAWMQCAPQGMPELREQIAARLSQQGVAAAAANIVTTSGASQAFDLLGRILLSPGDTVLVEDPGYFVLFEQLRSHHVHLVPIPRTPGGPDLEALEEACRTQRPRAFFTQTLLHNPTGSNTEPARCHRILSLAEQFGFAIIDDDVYGDLHAGPAVRLAQIDGLRHVVHIGSFTKLIGPALRVGYVAASPALVAQIVERKVLSVLSGSALLEAFVSEALDSGRYRKHIDIVRGRVARMRRAARQTLEATGIVFPDADGDGIFLWGRVPEGTQVDGLVRSARESSILLARGTLFSASRGCSQWLRFNVAHSTAPALIRFLREHLPAAA